MVWREESCPPRQSCHHKQENPSRDPPMPAFSPCEGRVGGWVPISRDCSDAWVVCLLEQARDEGRAWELRVVVRCGFGGEEICLKVGLQGSEAALWCRCWMETARGSCCQNRNLS